jgi:hyperosmotically inducible protein
MYARLTIGICGLAVVVATAGLASAQSAPQDVKEQTATAAQKTGATASDFDITTAVKTKLLADKTVGESNIDVDTNNGVVTLTGPVDSAAVRAQAIKIARHTHGVTRVVSKLTIETKASSSGSLVDKTENGAKKAGEATKDAAGKTIDTVKGTSGTVAKDTENAASKTGRVVTDAEITSSVKTKLAADSGVHAMDVKVDTDHGVVTLTGSVRSDAEKTDALRIAQKTMGVKSVVDKLTVK